MLLLSATTACGAAVAKGNTLLHRELRPPSHLCTLAANTCCGCDWRDLLVVGARRGWQEYSFMKKLQGGRQQGQPQQGAATMAQQTPFGTPMQVLQQQPPPPPGAQHVMVPTGPTAVQPMQQQPPIMMMMQAQGQMQGQMQTRGLPMQMIGGQLPQYQFGQPPHR